MDRAKSLKTIREFHEKVSLLHNEMNDAYNDAYPEILGIADDEDGGTDYFADAINALDDAQAVLFDIIEAQEKELNAD